MSLSGILPRGRRPYALAALVYLCVAGWFLVCAAPSLYWGDSAEMASVACSLGVPHSPGYPLFSVLMRPFTWLPGSPAFGLNVMGLVLAAAAAALLALFVLDVTQSLFAALCGAALLAAAPAFAMHSLAVDVYPLHMLLFAALLAFTGRHERAGDARWFLAAVAALSLGMAHHILMYFAFIAFVAYCVLRPGHAERVAATPLLLFFGFGMYSLLASHDLAAELRAWAMAALGALAMAYGAYLVFLGIKRRAELRRSLAACGAALFLFAAATFVFAYLPLASARGPAADWWSPETPANFLNLLFLKGYPPTFPDTAMELVRRVDLGGLIAQVPVLWLVAACAGGVIMLARRARLAVLLLLCGFLTLGGALLVQHGKPEALRLPVYAVAAILAAWLVGWLVRGGVRGLGLFYVISGVLAAAAAAALAIFTHGVLPARLLWILAGAGAFSMVWGAVFWRLKRRAFLIAPWYLAFAALTVFCFARPQLAALPALARSSGAHDLGLRIIRDTDPNGVLFIGAQAPGIMAYFQACEAGEIQKKNIAVIPVSFLGFDWKIEQLRRQYPDLHFPDRKIKSGDGDQVFSTRGAGHISYAQRMMAGSPPDRRFFSDFEFIPFEIGYTTVPHGAVNRILPGEDPGEVSAAAARDRTPDWSRAPRRDPVEARNLASVHSQRGHLFLLLGAVFQDQAYFEKACDESSRAVRICPECAAGFVNRGACKWYLGDDKGALRDMEHAVYKLRPDDPLVYNVYAETLLRRHTRPALERAIAILQISLQLEPNQPRVYNNLGTAFTMSGRKDAAVAMFRRALELEPGYIEVYRALSRLHESMGDCARSVGYLEDARDYIKNSGADAAKSLQSLDVNMELAIRYHACGWDRLFFDQMQQAYDTFRQPDGTYALDFFQAVGTAFREIGRQDITARIHAQARPLFPSYRLFDMYESLRAADCAQSVPAMRRAVMLSPQDFSLRVGYASTLAACRLPADAQRQLLAAKALNPREKGLDALFKDLYKTTSGIKIKGESGKYKINVFTNGKVNAADEALFLETALAEAEAQGVNAPEIMRALADLHRASGDCEAAADLYKEAVRMNPDNISLLTRQIRTLAACGLNDDIAAPLTALFEDFDKDYVFYLETGAMFRDLGQPEKAVQLYREFSRALPDIGLADLFRECGANDCARCLPLLHKVAAMEPGAKDLREHLEQTRKTCAARK